jgi:hypothetical protein
MMSPEVVPEFLPVDGFWFLMSFNISVLPIYSGSNQLMRCKQNPLSVSTLDDLQLLLNGLQPIISIHWLNGVRECWRLHLLELSKPVMLLELWHLLLTCACCMFAIVYCMVCSIWACMINTCSSVGGGGGLALLLLLFSLAPQLRVLAI